MNVHSDAGTPGRHVRHARREHRDLPDRHGRDDGGGRGGRDVDRRAGARARGADGAARSGLPGGHGGARRRPRERRPRAPPRGRGRAAAASSPSHIRERRPGDVRVRKAVVARGERGRGERQGGAAARGDARGSRAPPPDRHRRRHRRGGLPPHGRARERRRRAAAVRDLRLQPAPHRRAGHADRPLGHVHQLRARRSRAASPTTASRRS